LNPNAIKFMADDGIDISDYTSNHISEYKDVIFDFVITVCNHAKENCPYWPSYTLNLHHNFQDPSKVLGTNEDIEKAFLEVREEMKIYCKSFVNLYL
jgi:arsenate reductase (thioredoxin)